MLIRKPMDTKKYLYLNGNVQGDSFILGNRKMMGNEKIKSGLFSNLPIIASAKEVRKRTPFCQLWNELGHCGTVFLV